MIISMIVAVGRNHEIGLKGNMLWHIKEDFSHFKKTTMGHTLVMGRKTFESIGRPLPGRQTYILTRNEQYFQESCKTFTGLDAAIDAAKSAQETEVFIAGGGEIYQQGLELCDRIYLSEVEFEGEADAYFPKLEQSNWRDSVSPVFHEKTNKSLAWKLRILEKVN